MAENVKLRIFGDKETSRKFLIFFELKESAQLVTQNEKCEYYARELQRIIAKTFHIKKNICLILRGTICLVHRS